jgi:hypothetical protein
MVPRTFVHWICGRQFLFCVVRVHPCLYLSGPVDERGEILAHAIRADLSGVCFFTAVNGAMVFLCRDEIEIPTFCVGDRAFEVRLIFGSHAASGVGAGKRAGMEFGVLEPLGRVIFLFIISIIAVGFRATVTRAFAILRGCVVVRRNGRSDDLLVA